MQKVRFEGEPWAIAIIISPVARAWSSVRTFPRAKLLRALTRDGLIFDFALNNVASGVDEFSGATFGLGGKVLYANMQANGITYAIWGPWSNGLI